MIRRSQPNSVFPLEIGILYSLIWVSQWLSGFKKKKKKTAHNAGDNETGI